MDTIKTITRSLFDWISADWYSNRIRFVAELTAWLLSVSCALTMAMTAPNPPLHLIYPAWICGCIVYSWAAYSRKSFAMLANYVLLATIDVVGLVRILTA